MPDEKIKIYKNKERSKTEVRTAYVPQYQIMGVEPEEVSGGVASSLAGHVSIQSPQTQTNDNPRTRRVGIRQPYAAPSPSPVGGSRGPVPNVGNNMEHMWSSVNGDIIDDLSDVELDHPMIDNNDFVSNEALGLPTEKEELPQLNEVTHPSKKVFQSSIEEHEENDGASVIANLSEGDYLLIVSGVPVCSGPSSEVQEQARMLVFGDHELCDGNPIPVDDIVVIKRIPIKIGLFLD